MSEESGLDLSEFGEPGTIVCSTMLVENHDGTATLVSMPVPARYRYGTPEWKARHTTEEQERVGRILSVEPS